MTLDICSLDCEREAQCTVCGRPKPPNGRDVPAEASAGFCHHECRGYDLPPHPGHLWPGEFARSER